MFLAISSIKSPRGEDAKWGKYNNSFFPCDATPNELRGAVLQGRGFCSAHKHEAETWLDLDTGELETNSYRRIANFIGSGFVAFDFDNGDMSVSKLMDGGGDPWLSMHVAVAYSTKRSTPEHPRCRAVIPISEPYTDVNEYRKLCKALHAMYPTADPAMINPVQPWSGNDAPRVDVMLDEQNFLPRPTADGIIRQYEEKCAAELAHLRRADPYSGSGNVDYRLMAEALHAIPRQMNYMDWVKILMAVYSVMPGEEGIRLIESWSPGKPGEVTAKFRSFQHGVSVGLGTLYHYAGLAGWKREERRTSIAGVVARAAGGRIRKPQNSYRRY